jgi:hypothetical protein
MAHRIIPAVPARLWAAWLAGRRFEASPQTRLIGDTVPARHRHPARDVRDGKFRRPNA